MSRTLIATVSLLVLGAGAANAYSPRSSHEIDARQYRQEYRIEQGRRDGSLTRGEAARLEAEQARIRDLERAAKRDGYVDPYERARIRAAQDNASRHIRHERHDGDYRGWRRWWGGPGYGWGPGRWY